MSVDGNLRPLGDLLLCLEPLGCTERIAALADAGQSLDSVMVQGLALIVPKDVHRLGWVWLGGKERYKKKLGISN